MKRAVTGYFVHVWAGMIKEVILGCWITERHEHQIREALASKLLSNVKLLRAVRHKARFELEIVPAEDIGRVNKRFF
jgi:hypothetical protein